MIETASRRLAWSARLSRLFPPAISGRLATRLYPLEQALRENPAFRARSSLSRAVLSFPRTEETTWGFALRGFYEWRNVLVANQLCRRGDTIVEVGASLGTETVAFSAIVGESGRVIAFEALPDNFGSLREALEVNDLSNVTLYPQAVADRNGTASFAPPPDAGNMGTGRLIGDAADSACLRVETVTLDSMVERGAFQSPRMLCLDVEGAELDVLLGCDRMIRACRPFVLLEVNSELLSPHGRAPADILRYFHERDYACREIGGWSLPPAGEPSGGVNWLCIPTADAEAAERLAGRLARKMRLAAFLPLWCGFNPLVPSGRPRRLQRAFRSE